VSPVAVVALLALAQAWLCIRLAPFLLFPFLISFSPVVPWRRWPVRLTVIALLALITVGPGLLGRVWLASAGAAAPGPVAAVITLTTVLATLGFVYGIGPRANLPRLLRPALAVAATATAGLTALSWADGGSSPWLGLLVGAGVVAVATVVLRMVAPRLDRARLLAGLRQHAPRFRDNLLTLRTPPWRLAGCAARPGQLTLTYQHGRTAAAAVLTLQEDVVAPPVPTNGVRVLPTPGLPEHDGGAYLAARGRGLHLYLRLSPTVVVRVTELNPGALDWYEVAAGLLRSDDDGLRRQAEQGNV
jgi:hypothetical protein